MMTHELDDNGQPTHVDIDPFIPTGICAICAETPRERLAPEDRNQE
ncbi:hypothetical protein QFZ30_001490 [Arthrobacter pascens]|nr:hypothetical protein [Arthrobacter pascens]MDQ0678108.1 hypothetical protein [Arthrobacter pascens]